MSLRKKPGNGTASDIHTCEFILSNAIPMAVLTLNERSQFEKDTNLWFQPTDTLEQAKL